MELTHLRTFRMVAETLSFTRAAQRLNLTQSAVSHQIKALEEELGEPLFLRTPRGVRLSRAGQAALEHATRALDEAEALRERVSGRSGTLIGHVKAAAATQAFVHLFAPLFESFMRAHPDVELTFRSTPSTDHTVADILGGAADIGFASLPVRSPALKLTPLFEDELLLAVGREHAWAARASVTVEEIKDQRMILLEPGSSIRRATDRFFDQAGIEPASALESNDTDFIKSMVVRGLGVALLPPWSVRAEVASGSLARLRIEGQRLGRKVAAISLERFQPSATRAFLAFLVERRGELQSAASGD